MPTTSLTPAGTRIAVDLQTVPSVDVTDPLAAYVALRDLVGEDQVFLLESLAGPIADTRASLAGVTGLLEVQVHRSRVTFTGVPALVETAAEVLERAGVTRADGEGHRLTSDEGLFDLPRVLDAAFDVERDPGRFGFGLLVFHGYDAVRYIERLPRLIDDPADPAPDAVFALVRALVEIDLTELTGRLTVASSPGWPELDVAAVVEALEALPAPLAEPVVPAPVAVADGHDAGRVRRARRAGAGAHPRRRHLPGAGRPRHHRAHPGRRADRLPPDAGAQPEPLHEPAADRRPRGRGREPRAVPAPRGPHRHHATHRRHGPAQRARGS